MTNIYFDRMDLKAGDQVECVNVEPNFKHIYNVGKIYTIFERIGSGLWISGDHEAVANGFGADWRKVENMSDIDYQIAVMQAYKNGAEIESCNSFMNNSWKNCKIPIWDWSTYKYRVKPKVLKPDTVDWSHVHSDYNWMARDKCGSVFVYENKPIRHNTMWDYPTGACESIMALASYVQGDVAWEDSLVERPS